MAKPRLKNINGRFVESDYENALIAFLEREGWQYLYDDSIHRASRKDYRQIADGASFRYCEYTSVLKTSGRMHSLLRGILPV